jgi:uncharacterized delta-60 repeat protein
MKSRALLIGFVFLLNFGVFAGPLAAQHGIVTTPIGTGDDVGYSIKVQDDGKIVAGGYYETATYRDFVALRYHADLTLDESFDTDGIAPHNIWGNDNAESLIIQPDGKILLGGTSNQGGDMGCCDQYTVARLNTDGSADTGFGPSSSGHITVSIDSSWDLGRALALRSDGRMVLGGYIDDGAWNWNFALLGVKADGTLDPAFNPGGTYGMSPNNESKVVTSVDTGDDYGNAIAIQSDGKILQAGATHNGTNWDWAIVRFEADGDLDTTFGTGGIVTTDLRGYNDWGSSIALQSDGKIVFGSKSSNGTDNDFAVVRYNTDGSIDTTFGTNGMVFTTIGSGDDDGEAVTIQSDGKIVLAGFTWNGTDEDFAVVRYNTDGTLDTSFGTGGKVVTPIGSADDRAHGVTVQPDGKILVVGETDNGTNLDVAVVSYNSDGTLDESGAYRFRSVGTTATDLNTNSRTVEIYGTTATFSGAMPDNVGVGDVLQYQVTGTYYLAFIHGRVSDTVYTVVPADGGTPQAAAAGTAVAVYRAYTSLANWQALNENDIIDDTVENFDTSRDLVSANTIMKVACYGDGPDTTMVIIDGWTTSADNYIKIYTPYLSTEVGASQRHSGKWDNSKYRIESGVAPIRIGANSAGAGNVWIDGLQVYLSSVTGNGNSGILSYQTTQANHRISNNIIRSVTNNTYSYTGIYFFGAAASSEARIWNNIVYGFNGTNGSGISNSDADYTAYVYNNTVYDCSVGYATSGTSIAKNNIAYNNTNNYSGSFNAASTNNLSGPSQTDAPGSNPRNAVTVTFVDPSGSPPDFHLDSTDIGAKGYGTDLSGDASLDFTEDIDGGTRSGLWDIGADEYGVGSSTTLYRSVGTTATALENGTGNALTISGSTATFVSGLANNIGVGDVIEYDSDGDSSIDALAFIHGRINAQAYTVKDKDGNIPTAVSGDNDWAIYRAYTSLANWESQTENPNITEPAENDVNPSTDLVTANTILIVACYGDGFDSSAVTINGWTTGPNNYIKIYTPYLSSEVGTSQRHSGVWDDGKYRIEASPSNLMGVVTIRDEYVRVEGLQIEVQGTNESYGILGDLEHIQDLSDIRLSHNIIGGTGTLAAWATGISIFGYGFGNDPLIKIWDNIIYDFTSASASGIYGTNEGNPTIYIYNNTVYGCTIGYYRDGNGVLIAKNNIAFNNGDDYYGSFSTASDNNLGEDAAFSGDSNYVQTTQTAAQMFGNPTGSPRNLHVLNTSDATDAGADLSSDASLDFSDDIDGDSRPFASGWDIGADETDGRIAHWKLDEGTDTTADDSAGTNDGTLAGPSGGLPAWTCVTGGYALTFDGDDDEVSLPGPIIGDRAAWTVTAWIKVGADTADKRTIYSEGDTSADEYWTLYVGETENVVKFWSPNGSAYMSGTTNVEDDTWHLVTLVQRSKTDRELYVGTVSQDTDNADMGTLTYNTASIGLLRANGWTADWFLGTIDDVRIYDRALSVADSLRQQRTPNANRR